MKYIFNKTFSQIPNNKLYIQAVLFKGERRFFSTKISFTSVLVGDVKVQMKHFKSVIDRKEIKECRTEIKKSI